MQPRPLRFLCVGVSVAVLLSLAIVAVGQPSARAATPDVDFPITIGSGGFTPCDPTLALTTLNLNPVDTLTFQNTINQSVTIDFTFDNHGVITKQSISVAAGKSRVFTPPANENFSFSSALFPQSHPCVGSVSEAIPQTPTGTTVPGSVPPTGGGPVPPAAQNPPWLLWGVLLTVLGLAGLGGTLALCRRWVR